MFIKEFFKVTANPSHLFINKNLIRSLLNVIDTAKNLGCSNSSKMLELIKDAI
jgi:hypothetical protein